MRQAHGVNLAEASVSNPLARLASSGDRTVLRAHLHDPIVAARCPDHLAPLVDRPAQRLFAIYVFASLAGHDRDGGMPVVRRSDQHRVDVLPIQDMPEIRVHIALADPLPGRGGAVLIHIANGGDRAARVVVDGQQTHPAPAASDQGRRHALVGRPLIGSTQNVAGDHSRRDQARSRTAQKVTPIPWTLPGSHRSLLRDAMIPNEANQRRTTSHCTNGTAACTTAKACPKGLYGNSTNRSQAGALAHFSAGIRNLLLAANSLVPFHRRARPAGKLTAQLPLCLPRATLSSPSPPRRRGGGGERSLPRLSL